ncbi:MAG TPA: hypothetical protein VK781_05300, partial [Solirubrobacteraceae bacterium]|nr:hypothetical protein [Solirubrobacteraceae bacterium]
MSGSNGLTGEYRWLSEDLSCAIIQSSEPLTTDTPAADIPTETRNLYRRNPDGSYTLLSNQVPLNPGADSSDYYVFGVSRDCQKVFFQTPYRLLPGAPEGQYGSLYEWDQGTLRFAGVLPDGSLPAQGVDTMGEMAPWNFVSPDGSRVVFAAGTSGVFNKQIFVREDNGTSKAKTVEISASKTSIPDEAVLLQGESKSDSRVFFTGNYGIAPGPTSTGVEKFCDTVAATNQNQTPRGCDLYEYDVESGALTDLSADGNNADVTGADVAGVLDLSEDGSYVYFAAMGQLTPGSGDPSENTQEANESNKELNVYLTHDGHLSFVSRIALHDAESNGANADLITIPGYWSARATPDGKKLLFTSHSRLTSYDNTDSVRGTPDPEAYLFSLDTKKTVCVSCDPTGARPVPELILGSPVEAQII